MNYYDGVLQKVSEIVGDAGEVSSVNEPAKSLYSIFVKFIYPWTDPVGIEDYYLKIAELVGVEGDGRVRMTVEPSTAEPGKVFAKIAVVYKTFYKTQVKELQ